MDDLITKAELARLAGVTKGAMTKLFKPGGRLHPALVGRKVDATNPLIVNYLESREADPRKPAPKPAPPPPIPSSNNISKLQDKTGPAPPPPPPPPPLPESPAQPPLTATVRPKASPLPGHEMVYEEDGAPAVEELQDLTLGEILLRWGTVPRFVSYLDAVKKMEEIAHRRTMTQEKRGQLVDRKLMAATFTAVVEQAFKRLVTDIPEGVATSVVARAQAGGPDARLDVLELIRAANAKALNAAKSKVLDSASG